MPARRSSRPAIPVGIVFSQTGPYAMMGREMLCGAMLAIEEIAQDPAFDFGFVPVVRDPGGRVSAYHDACDALIRHEGVDHVIGCYTSASRKEVLPLFERTERLLWHPARYEGFECSDQIIYVGASPNHNVVPLARYMIESLADEVFCVGSNYVWTWETNRVMREIVGAAGGRILAERLLDLGGTGVAHMVDEIMARRPPVVFNTLVGESSYRFVQALHAALARAGAAIPMLSCSLCEPELRRIGPEASVGCITSSAYFESLDRPENHAFVARWKARFGAESSPSVDGQATYVAAMLLARAVRRAGTTEAAAVRQAAAGHVFEAPQGPVWIDPSNNHCFATPRLARSMPGNSFEIFWEAPAPMAPDPYLSALNLAGLAGRRHPREEMIMPRPRHLRVVK
ncbi:transporter substrate-binding domain-containing protein [Methylobacterium sp. 17Sr1-1]|uniref:transporter substrate-binding domain-containing protein n=1 Tax=Methylobacterium sp. 17Sr1-1 TaxID=2202826 RepID=UPI000D6EC4C8|nr:transporter substrate-binding domain-containing protein [Methylobacterium sp. 17Sr1-1]AWN54634.1 N-acetylmuramoyl-L-alanine amidase [Methylobacterium sp. 17Sr1-1]